MLVGKKGTGTETDILFFLIINFVLEVLSYFKDVDYLDILRLRDLYCLLVGFLLCNNSILNFCRHSSSVLRLSGMLLIETGMFLGSPHSS